MSTGPALRRSAELEKLIQADASGFRISTGDRPTGQLHVGHYFGTLRNRVRLQDLGAEVGQARPGFRRHALRPHCGLQTIFPNGQRYQSPAICMRSLGYRRGGRA